MNKLDEEVLVIPRSSFDPEKFNGTFSEFSEIVNKNALFLKRSIAETDESHLQLIPYVTLVFDDKYVFTYKRLKAGSEARLHDNYSIGIGGHIEASKDLSNDPKNPFPMQALMNGAIREIREEVSMVWAPTPSKLSIKQKDFLIYDNSNEVGRVHLGIIMTYTMLSTAVKVKEVTKIEGQFRSLSYLKSSGLHFENWTNKVLACL